LTPPMRHGYDVGGVRFSRDGRAVITVGMGGQLQLWDAAAGEPLTPPLPAETGLHAVTPDGRLVAVGAQPRAWDVRPDGRPVAELRQLVQVLAGHRIDDTGGYVPLDEAEFATHWQQLPADAQPAPPERAWHAAQAERFEAADRWGEVTAHLTPLIDA